MSSFYGGRAGESFVIVKTFSTVSEMVAAFSQGGNYKDVSYGQYVMIQYQNHENNGKIYKRGYNYQDGNGGAEYIGQICGPQGYIPQVNEEEETLYLLNIITQDVTG